ncbi:MAG: hypothetical protein HOJ48_16345 [Desulfobacula sp.]|jgi:hypothetical protein|nr:hypothetical protein [Desulfobacula sp.]
MNKKLSDLQRFILKEAHKKGTTSNADILIKHYGFKQVSYGSIKFDRHQIGMKRYLSATASVARSLTRLRDRGLMIRNSWFGHCLTETGIQAVKKYML